MFYGLCKVDVLDRSVSGDDLIAGLYGFHANIKQKKEKKKAGPLCSSSSRRSDAATICLR